MGSLEEFLLIGIVALIVIRPERWPEVAYHLGRFVRHLRNLPEFLTNLWQATESRRAHHQNSEVSSEGI